jgi:exonuclease SbcC
MQLKLKSVRLVNIRIHEDYTFTPAMEGVTAIVGRTGHGKSTIVDGIAWALFGTKPNSSMKAAEMRRSSAPDDAAAYVDLYMDMNGDEIRVKRSVNSKGAVSCECWLNGDLEAGPAVSHTKRWITKTLGLDEDGFLSAVLVQQKQVDSLVSASPSIRRNILEKLTGITAITNATDIAHDEEKSYNKVVGALQTDDTKLPKLESTKVKLNASLNKTNEDIKTLKAKLDTVNHDGQAMSKDLHELESLGTQYHSLSSSLATSKREADMLASRQSELMERQQKLKATLPAESVDIQQGEAMSHTLETQENKLSQLKSNVDMLRTTVDNRVSDDIVNAKRTEITALNNTIGKIDANDENNQMNALRALITSSKSQMKTYKKSLASLDAGEMQTCPTCLQDVDDPEHVIKEFNVRIAALEKTINESKAQLDTKEEEQQQYLETRKQLDTLNHEMETIDSMNDKADEADEVLIDRMAQLKTLESEVKTLRKTVSRLAADREKRRYYDNVVNEFKSVTDKYNESVRKLRATETEFAGIEGKFTDKKLESARKAMDKKKDEQSKLIQRITKNIGDRDLLAERIRSTENEIVTISESVENKKTMLSKLEIASGSVAVLSKFREHMILNAIPQITDYASDLIRKITDGKFTDVQIDQKFNMTVTTDDGTDRNVLILSGGELSTVAICMRVAISVMLSGGSPSLMMLDEVLTAMDADRAEAILNAIQDMNDGQIIIIAHNEIVKSIADCIIEL